MNVDRARELDDARRIDDLYPDTDDAYQAEFKRVQFMTVAQLDEEFDLLDTLLCDNAHEYLCAILKSPSPKFAARNLIESLRDHAIAAGLERQGIHYEPEPLRTTT